jgi:hypothetical protein
VCIMLYMMIHDVSYSTIGVWYHPVIHLTHSLYPIKCFVSDSPNLPLLITKRKNSNGWKVVSCRSLSPLVTVVMATDADTPTHSRLSPPYPQNISPLAVTESKQSSRK